MKAMVIARLLLGQIDSWENFASERAAAGKIQNRRVARRAAGQIGWSYRELQVQTQNLIAQNFDGCTVEHLAKLCDEMAIGVGIHLPIPEFEAAHFRIADRVKKRVPGHAHVSISPYGLQFEFPEYHFLRDIEAAFNDLAEVTERIQPYRARTNTSTKSKEVSALVGREKFLCRAIFSASYSLVESFLSGLLFSAARSGYLGRHQCDQAFIDYAKTKERNASMRDRLDKVVQVVTSGLKSARHPPFGPLMELKWYRDAIHHTTPFGRQGAPEGVRLETLYEIDVIRALGCAAITLDTILEISEFCFPDYRSTAIWEAASKLRAELPLKVSFPDTHS